jgi:hypothetical protein
VIFAKISQPGDEFLSPVQILDKNTLSENRIREKIEKNLHAESDTSFLNENERKEIKPVLPWLSASIGTSIMDGSSSWEQALKEADDDLRMRKSDDGTVHRLITGIRSLDRESPSFSKYMQRLQKAIENKKEK